MLTLPPKLPLKMSNPCSNDDSAELALANILSQCRLVLTDWLGAEAARDYCTKSFT